MEQKIYNSDESRIKRNLEFNYINSWWLRSANSPYPDSIGFVNHCGMLSNYITYDYYCVSPVCMI